MAAIIALFGPGTILGCSLCDWLKFLVELSDRARIHAKAVVSLQDALKYGVNV
jgi:hypothetical protein